MSKEIIMCIIFVGVVFLKIGLIVEDIEFYNKARGRTVMILSNIIIFGALAFVVYDLPYVINFLKMFFFLFIGILIGFMLELLSAKARTKRMQREMKEKRKQQRYKEIQIEIEKANYGRRK